jgi:predicted nucleic acid-binding protein
VPILFDTDVLIDVSRGEPNAVGRLRREASVEAPFISVITRMEMVVGCRSKNDLRKLSRFLKGFRVAKLDEPICDRAVALLERHGLSHGLQMPDALIAATALAHGLPLITKNRKHFQFIRGLTLPPYP